MNSELYNRAVMICRVLHTASNEATGNDSLGDPVYEGVAEARAVENALASLLSVEPGFDEKVFRKSCKELLTKKGNVR